MNATTEVTIRASERVLTWFHALNEQDKNAVRFLLRLIKTGWEFGDVVKSWKGEGIVRYMKDYGTSPDFPHGIRVLYTVYESTGIDVPTLIAILNIGDHTKSALGGSAYRALTHNGKD